MGSVRQRGFTLVELVIVIAVVALLAAIALPSYQDSIRKSRRAAAQADMMEIVQLAERFYTANTTYQGFVLPAGWNVTPRNGARTDYTLALATTARTFTVTATPSGGQTGDSCGTLSINHQNIRTNSSGEFSRCW